MSAENIYRNALEWIAAGTGYYGAQAREYKERAKAALAEVEALKRAEQAAQVKARRGLDCGVSLRTGRWECSCGDCPSIGR